ncbi:MAG: mechanosensitive ion channel [Pseudazoarcus pumilus]|nr:mechanosensitive ion channel [Pseudazoarcus pumilus]
MSPARPWPALIAALAVFLLLFCGTAAANPAPDNPTPASAAQLADLLENETTRQALIEQLRRSSAESTAAPTASAPATPSLPQRVAATTRAVAERTVAEAAAAAAALSTLRTEVSRSDSAVLARDAGLFALFVFAVLVLHQVFRRVSEAPCQRLDHWTRAGGDTTLLRRLVAVGCAMALQLAAVLAAWLAGYGVALWMPGAEGAPRVLDALFLNAFVIVEALRATLATLLSTRFAALRAVDAGEETAYWLAWASRMSLFVGYGLLLVAPAAGQLVAPEVGRVLTLLIVLLAFLKAAVIVLQNRARSRAALEALGERMQTGFARVALNMLARVWHIAALGYLAALLLVALFYPEQALGFMFAATLQSVLAMLVGVVLARVLSTVIMRRIQLPEETRARFPLLEDRLNAYIPGMLKIARFAILAVVLAVVVDAWTSFDLGTWVASDAGMAVIGRLVTVFFIIGLALLVWLLSASWIEYRLNPDAGSVPTARAKTLLTIFRNVVAIALVVLTAMVVLAELGVNIGPLIAGAGVLGLAIGFGSQKLVQDVITGLFIQLEHAINVGDVVTAGGITGGVEKLTIRSLGIRDLAGVYHLIPFSSVDMVSNFNRDFGYHVGEYGVAYREDTDEVIEHLKAAFEELRADPDHGVNILGDLEVHGVTALADSSVNIRVRIKTQPGTQAPTGRAYNRLVKRHFDAAGIEIPFPHMTVYFGEDKQGKAPAANLRLLGTPPDKEV